MSAHVHGHDKSHPHIDASPVHLLHLSTFFLSVYALGALVAQTLCRLPEDVAQLLDQIDVVICFIFLAEFFINLFTAKSKLHFLKWGWIDFISSIPVLPVFRIARVVRIIRIIRVLRAFRSTKVLAQFVYSRRAHGTLMTAAVITVLLTIFSSIAMLNLETSPDSNIKTANDALWWAATTMTTVGYGDRYPVTSGGRIVAVFLMTAGVGLFAIFTGWVTSCFNDAEVKEEKATMQTLVDEIKLLRQKIETLEQLALNDSASLAVEEESGVV
jgi:voltage-gated potassium channel